MNEYGSAEAVLSAVWFQTSAHTLAAGLGVKSLRIYDIRASNPSLSTTTKIINGIKMDPMRENIFASYSDENVIALWDTRYFTEPVFSIVTETGPIEEVQFCPSRRGVLASFSRDEFCLDVWELHDHTSDSSPRGQFEFWKSSKCLC